MHGQGRVSIPQNIIFDNDGFEIKHFNDKLCSNQALKFLKNFSEKKNKSNYKISDYLKHFKSININSDSNKIPISKKISVFVSTPTYADKYKANEEAFEIYKHFRDKFEVYVVNLD